VTNVVQPVDPTASVFSTLSLQTSGLANKQAKASKEEGRYDTLEKRPSECNMYT
jgi:hypothetical protein